MKVSTTLAVANLLVAGAATAQVSVGQGPVTSSSVTLFGVADAAVAYGSGSFSHITRLVSGANTPSRVGFRGTEDLGGGLGANFWLELGYNQDDGTGQTTNINNQANGSVGDGGLTFNRRATVSLIDRWGEVRAGRDFIATYRNRDQTDPFGTNGVGASQPNVGTLAGPTATRVSNMVGYYLPPGLGGFFGEAQVFMGENASISPNFTGTPNADDGDGYAARVGYNAGSFGVAVAAANTKYALSPTTGDIQVVNVGAFYDFGIFKLTAGYFRDKVESLLPVTGTGYIVGGLIPVGFDQVRVSYSSYGTDELFDPRTNKFAIGYVYNFSKRTAAYATYARVSNEGGASTALNGSMTFPNHSSWGYDLGLRHNF